jgi:hypothetical protein
MPPGGEPPGPLCGVGGIWKFGGMPFGSGGKPGGSGGIPIPPGGSIPGGRGGIPVALLVPSSLTIEPQHIPGGGAAPNPGIPPGIGGNPCGIFGGIPIPPGIIIPGTPPNPPMLFIGLLAPCPSALYEFVMLSMTLCAFSCPICW